MHSGFTRSRQDDTNTLFFKAKNGVVALLFMKFRKIFSDKAVDVRTGEKIQAKIDDVAYGGDGVARVDDFVLFVPYGVDGDEVEIEIVDLKKNYGKGRIVGMMNPSPYRVSPPCPYYGLCGGCSMQHISYSHQLELKKHQIEESLRRIAGIEAPPLREAIASPHPFGWRGKAEFHLSAAEEKKKIGLMAPQSNRIIEVEKCLIADDSINRKYMKLKEEMKEGLAVPAGDRVIVWADDPQGQPTEIFLDAGKPPDITRIVKEKRLTVPGGGFFQANRFLLEGLIDEAVAMAALNGGETVFDLYGGVGLFALFLGEKAGRLFCVEGDPEAVRCARINMDRYGLTEAKCYQGDVSAVLKRQFAGSLTKADVVLLDPPRDGCGGKVIDALSAFQPKRLVYVSCNPATQARDIKGFLKNGYRLETMQPMDMFPQTPHVESIALLARCEN